MSVVIRGLKVPKNCDSCPFCDYEQAHCLASDERPTDDTRRTQRMEWCPMDGLPEKHGRLIDADEFEVIGYCAIPGANNDTFDDGVRWLAEKIDKAKTIVKEEL